MNRRFLWPLGGLLALVILAASFSHTPAQRGPMQFFGGGQVGRFVVAKTGDDKGAPYVIILDTTSGKLYKATEKDFLKYSELPKVEPMDFQLPFFDKDKGPKDKAPPPKDKEELKDKGKEKKDEQEIDRKKQREDLEEKKKDEQELARKKQLEDLKREKDALQRQAEEAKRQALEELERAQAERQKALEAQRRAKEAAEREKKKKGDGQ